MRVVWMIRNYPLNLFGKEQHIMSNEYSIEDYFSEHIDSFTIYVVEQKFAVNQGREYFKHFATKEHFINNNT